MNPFSMKVSLKLWNAQWLIPTWSLFYILIWFVPKLKQTFKLNENLPSQYPNDMNRISSRIKCYFFVEKFSSQTTSSNKSIFLNFFISYRLAISELLNICAIQHTQLEKKKKWSSCYIIRQATLIEYNQQPSLKLTHNTAEQRVVS